MSSYKYDPKSLKAEEFINHEEILESLDYAKKNKDNLSLIREIILAHGGEIGIESEEGKGNFPQRGSRFDGVR